MSFASPTRSRGALHIFEDPTSPLQFQDGPAIRAITSEKDGMLALRSPMSIKSNQSSVLSPSLATMLKPRGQAVKKQDMKTSTPVQQHHTGGASPAMMKHMAAMSAAKVDGYVGEHVRSSTPSLMDQIAAIKLAVAPPSRNATAPTVSFADIDLHLRSASKAADVLDIAPSSGNRKVSFAFPACDASVQADIPSDPVMLDVSLPALLDAQATLTQLSQQLATAETHLAEARGQASASAADAADARSTAALSELLRIETWGEVNGLRASLADAQAQVACLQVRAAATDATSQTEAETPAASTLSDGLQAELTDALSALTVAREAAAERGVSAAEAQADAEACREEIAATRSAVRETLEANALAATIAQGQHVSALWAVKRELGEAQGALAQARSEAGEGRAVARRVAFAYGLDLEWAINMQAETESESASQAQEGKERAAAHQKEVAAAVAAHAAKSAAKQAHGPQPAPSKGGKGGAGLFSVLMLRKASAVSKDDAASPRPRAASAAHASPPPPPQRLLRTSSAGPDLMSPRSTAGKSRGGSKGANQQGRSGIPKPVSHAPAPSPAVPANAAQPAISLPASGKEKAALRDLCAGLTMQVAALHRALAEAEGRATLAEEEASRARIHGYALSALRVEEKGQRGFTEVPLSPLAGQEPGAGRLGMAPTPTPHSMVRPVVASHPAPPPPARARAHTYTHAGDSPAEDKEAGTTVQALHAARAHLAHTHAAAQAAEGRAQRAEAALATARQAAARAQADAAGHAAAASTLVAEQAAMADLIRAACAERDEAVALGGRMGALARQAEGAARAMAGHRMDMRRAVKAAVSAGRALASSSSPVPPASLSSSLLLPLGRALEREEQGMAAVAGGGYTGHTAAIDCSTVTQPVGLSVAMQTSPLVARQDALVAPSPSPWASPSTPAIPHTHGYGRGASGGATPYTEGQGAGRARLARLAEALVMSTQPYPMPVPALDEGGLAEDAGADIQVALGLGLGTDRGEEGLCADSNDMAISWEGGMAAGLAQGVALAGASPTPMPLLPMSPPPLPSAGQCMLTTSSWSPSLGTGMGTPNGGYTGLAGQPSPCTLLAAAAASSLLMSAAVAAAQMRDSPVGDALAIEYGDSSVAHGQRTGRASPFAGFGFDSASSPGARDLADALAAFSASLSHTVPRNEAPASPSSALFIPATAPQAESAVPAGAAMCFPEIDQVSLEEGMGAGPPPASITFPASTAVPAHARAQAGARGRGQAQPAPAGPFRRRKWDLLASGAPALGLGVAGSGANVDARRRGARAAAFTAGARGVSSPLMSPPSTHQAPVQTQDDSCAASVGSSVFTGPDGRPDVEGDITVWGLPAPVSTAPALPVPGYTRTTSRRGYGQAPLGRASIGAWTGGGSRTATALRPISANSSFASIPTPVGAAVGSRARSVRYGRT